MKKYNIIFSILIALYLVMSCNINTQDSNENNPYLVSKTIRLSNGSNLMFYTLLPEVYYDSLTYPVVLAFPPGDQANSDAEWLLNRFFIQHSVQRYWVVVSPVAPGGDLFHEGNAFLIDEFLDSLIATFNPEGFDFHLAGVSNGGKSAFRAALDHPTYFQSLTVFPGYPPEADDFANLDQLQNMDITLVVGGQDDAVWTSNVEKTNHVLDSLGIQNNYKIYPTDGHVLQTFDTDSLFMVLESYR